MAHLPLLATLPDRPATVRYELSPEGADLVHATAVQRRWADASGGSDAGR